MSILAAPNTAYTPADLLLLRDGDNYELVNGQLVERHMGFNAGRIGARIIGLLDPFVLQNRLGTVVNADSGYQCFPGTAGKVRRADLSFISASRLPTEAETEGHCRIHPDLVVEVVSPNDEFEDVVEKVEEWLGAGVRLAWLVSPRTRTIWVFRRDGSGILLREKDELTGEDVLPGFRCAIREIFLPPPGADTPS